MIYKIKCSPSNFPSYLLAAAVYIAICCCITVANQAVCKAQDTSAKASLLPNFSFKWSPTSLFEPKSYIQLGIEHKLTNALFANYELGISPNIGLDNTSSDSYGARFRFDLRWYVNANRDKNTIAHFFIAPEVFGKYEQWKEPQWVEQAGGAYAEEVDVNYKKYVYGGNALIGVKITPQNTPITVDILGGLGLKVKDITKDLPEAADIWVIKDFFNFNIPGIYPNMVFGVKLGYAIP